ncbi:hypothetical protein LWF15_17795 [Kineosporia rhizophila]|uniref:hypothetical protein n=1 Tax=Kineosporia TaxID=49184 RepID=UPI001E3C65F2|nr:MULTISPECIES: hypothetical protein [Kineosporia]MCE0537359.1 hypothetical protein [Kineosporia rhizophila]GLY17494.1 hypothetical protein Kisp01_45080 [Kineosporia sp. NBRC 101677]
MTSETGSRRPIDAPNDRTMRDSLQQPVKGAPVDAPLHEETADAAVAGPAGTAQPAQPVQPAYRDPAYRDPAYQEPVYQEEPVRRSEPTRTATISSPGRIGFGAGVLVLGILLGMSDQQADGAGMALRVPALIAALIMVAQGIQLILRGLPRQTEVEVVEVVDDTDPAHPRTAVRPRPWSAGMAAFRTDPGSLGLPTLVIVLAIWLGLATLRIDDAPANLSNLSMLSAFVLFALGWTLIPARA